MIFEVEKKLPLGVEVAPGVISQKFRLRAALVGDSVAAVEECGPESSFMRLKFATLARRLTIDMVDCVTTELVLGLHDVDLIAIEEAADELEDMIGAAIETSAKR